MGRKVPLFRYVIRWKTPKKCGAHGPSTNLCKTFCLHISFPTSIIIQYVSRSILHFTAAFLENPAFHKITLRQGLRPYDLKHCCISDGSANESERHALGKQTVIATTSSNLYWLSPRLRRDETSLIMIFKTHPYLSPKFYMYCRKS